MLISSRKSYTQDGILRLSRVLQATLSYNRWSERELARKAGISPGSANRYVNGRITAPQDEILKSIAPHIYVAIDIRADGVEIDPTRTYGENWIDLERIALYGIRKPKKSPKYMEILQTLINEYLAKEKINEEEFARRALLHPIVIRTILDQGNILGDGVVILSLIASVLKNPQTGQTFTGWLELAQYCGFPVEVEDSADNSQQNHLNHSHH